MKLILFLGFFMGAFVNVNAQIQTADNLAAAEAPQLNGDFSFDYNQGTFYVRFDREDHLYYELDAQSQIVSSGEFKVFESGHFMLIPTSPSNGIVVKQEMTFTVDSSTNNSLSVSVVAQDGKTADVTLEKM